MAAEINPATEAALLKRTIQGEQQAFGALYEHYLDQIYRYVFYRVGNASEAEDLTEVVFLKAWQALRRQSAAKANVQNFRAWLFRIAHNAVIDHYRSNNPEVPLDQVTQMKDSQLAPEEQLVANQRTQRLAQVMAKLEPNLQQVLTCRFINQLSHAETAQIMGISEANARVLQHRALKLMHGLMTESSEANE